MSIQVFSRQADSLSCPHPSYGPPLKPSVTKEEHMQHIRVSPSLAIGVAVVLLSAFPLAAQTPISVYGAWHCYTDGCSWASVPNMTTFDTDNHWMIDRNMNNTYEPSVNLVILSFVDPVKL